jgi:hypothetical protein
MKGHRDRPRSAHPSAGPEDPEADAFEARFATGTPAPNFAMTSSR